MFPLGAACESGAVEIVNYLLDIGANVSADVKSVSALLHVLIRLIRSTV
jgi:ankyrin repeat protein